MNYLDDVGTPPANLLLIKIFLNSVISMPGAQFTIAGISNFYLMTPLLQTESARVKLSNIREEIINEYDLHEKASLDGWVYIKVVQGMYGLPQSGSLGHDLLEQRLNQEGYFQSKIVPGFWMHKDRKIRFVLVVDDFGINFVQQGDLDQLINTLKCYYDIIVDMSGKEYVKINLNWDYENQQVNISMKPYLERALKQFGITPRKEGAFPLSAHANKGWGHKAIR